MTEMKEMVNIVNKDEYDVLTAEYNPDSNTVHTVYADGTEEWREFDSNTARYKAPDGEEIIYKYDSNNNKIYHKAINSDGTIDDECWMEYDLNNNVIHVMRADSEIWNEYDDNNHIIHQKHSNGNELFWEYDQNGRLIRWGEPNGEIFEY